MDRETLNPKPPEETDPALQRVTQRLEKADFSPASSQRGELRAWLQEEAGRRQSRQRFHSGLRLLGEIGGLGLLLALFVLGILSLMRSNPPLPGAQGTQSPAPAATPTLAGIVLPRETPTRIPTLYPTLNPTDPDRVRISIMEQTWNTLWMEAEAVIYPKEIDSTEAPKKVFMQASLDKKGRGLVLSSAEIPGNPGFNADIEARYITASDGNTLTFLDKRAAAPETKVIRGVTYPLVDSSPAIQLVQPAFLAIFSSSPRITRQEQILERQAIVAEWGDSILWIDTQTGILLRADRYTGQPGKSALHVSLVMRRFVTELPFGDEIFTPQYIRELVFKVNPFSPTPTPFIPQPTQPGPTPTAIPPDILTNSMIYFEAAGQAPFEWKVYSIPAFCLLAPPCQRAIHLPGQPNVQISSLAWARDGSLGVFSETNNNQLVGLDPKTGAWLRLVKGFFQPGLVWSPDGSQIAALAEGDGAYDDRLVLVKRSGWTIKELPVQPKGSKVILGWLDAQTLLVDIPPVSSFKGETPAWIKDFSPGVYRINTLTGEAQGIQWGVPGKGAPLLSPRGDKLLFSRMDNGREILAIAGVDGSNLSVLTEGSTPAWSPDGQWILFWRPETPRPDGGTQQTLYVFQANGKGLIKVITVETPPDMIWSPDGKFLLLARRDTDQAQLVLVSLADGEIRSMPMQIVGAGEPWGILGWQIKP